MTGNKIINFIKVKIDYFAIFAIFLSAFTFYIPAIEGDFVFDDIPLISSDPFYHTNTQTSYFDCFTRTWWRRDFSQGLYRPITQCTYLFNVKTVGLESSVFRLTNILMNSTLCALLYLLFWKISSNRLIAFSAAILFAVHPLHSEAVIPASGRADLLAALFLVCGLLIHISKLKIRYLFIFLFGLLALLSKEIGILLLPIIFLYDLFFESDFHKKIFGLTKSLSSYFAAFLSILLYFLLRIYLIKYSFPHFSDSHYWSDNHLGLMGAFERLPTALWLQFFAIWKFIFPKNLSHDYSYAEIVPINSFYDLRNSQTFFCSIIVISLIVFLYKRNLKNLIFYLTAYFISILPTANIITTTGTIFGERLYYFPSIFLCIFSIEFIVFLMQKGILSRRIIAIFAISVFISFFVRLSLRIFDWKDQYSLACAGVKSSPNSFKVWNNYALQLYDKNLMDEAEKAFTKSIKINPSNLPAWRNRGNTRLKLGKNKEALSDFLECIKIGTKDVQVYNKAGALLAIEGNKIEAVKLWKKSLAINPDQPEISKALSEILKEGE